jgi:hypothetical protein
MLTVFCFGSFIVAPILLVAYIMGDDEQIHSGYNPADDESPRYEFVSNYCGDYVIVRKPTID